jgi:hypothetical protein
MRHGAKKDFDREVRKENPRRAQSQREMTSAERTYPPAFNSVNTCLAISFSVSKTPTP